MLPESLFMLDRNIEREKGTEAEEGKRGSVVINREPCLSERLV